MFAEDLSVFFNADEHGTAATYRRSGATASTAVVGIFDKAYTEPIEGVVEGSVPVFRCAASVLPNAAHGDALAVDGLNYIVRGVKHDGSRRVVLLVLEEQ